MDNQDRDLFGNPVPPKRRRGRKTGEASSSEGDLAGTRQLGRTAPAPPGLGDLVTRLKPLHRRLEADLAGTLGRDRSLQAAVDRQCEALSQDMGVVVGSRQYLHAAATVAVLKALFLRVAEDYGLFPGPARKVALRGDLFSALRDLAPRLTWADYLEYAVRDLAYLPVAYDLFKETGYELVVPSDEVARALLDGVGDLPDLRAMDTRALGDLYEHLMDPEEQKRLAYYPTPDFIIDFILDHTLEPAVKEFGVFDVRYLDICCGTGHFGVRAYRRLDHHLAIADPVLTPLERFEHIVENNLFAVDVSEFATHITLFRLFLEGVRLAQHERRDPATWGADLTFNVYTANSLIKLPRQEAMPLFADSRPPLRELDPVAPWYRRELTHLRIDLHDVLDKGFHVINANPPYVRIAKQGALVIAPSNGSWQVVEFVEYLRRNYQSASGAFDLSVPFAERGLELLVPGAYLGYITSSKFSKQAYGKRIASLLAGERFHLLLFADLTDARVFGSTTYPAIMIVQRPHDDRPVAGNAHVDVLATHAPSASTAEEDWANLRDLLVRPEDMYRPYAAHYVEQQGHFRSHPWTLRRAQRDLLTKIQAQSDRTLADYLETIGEDMQTNADTVFCDYITESFIRRHRLEREACIPCLHGENIRNWTANWQGNRKRDQTYIIYTHDRKTGALIADLQNCFPGTYRYLLRYRDYLLARATWGRITYKQASIPFYRLHQTDARLGAPKMSFPKTSAYSHIFYEPNTAFIVQCSAETAYLKRDMHSDVERAIAGIQASSVFNYWVFRTAGRVQRSYLQFLGRTLRRFPLPHLEDNSACERIAAVVERLLAWHESSLRLCPYRIIRESLFQSAAELQNLMAQALAEREEAIAEARQSLDALDHAVYDLYLLSESEHAEFEQRAYKQAWQDTDWSSNLTFEIRDFACDLIEDIFAAQRPLQERPLTPAYIAGILAQNPKFEPLRAVHYGGRPVSADQFVRECLDWDCRSIPFNPEAVLVGRRPKRVDILHERFFRFDGVDRNLYAWTGWSAEAQANVFLTLAERTQDPLPFYRWVARLIRLPEEAPDIADPALRAGLEALIGNAEPYPYVVMEKE